MIETTQAPGTITLSIESARYSERDATYYAAEHFKPGTHYYVAPSGIMFHLGNGATPDYSQSFPFGKTVMPSGPYVHTDHPRFMFREAPEHA